MCLGQDAEFDFIGFLIIAFSSTFLFKYLECLFRHIEKAPFTYVAGNFQYQFTKLGTFFVWSGYVDAYGIKNYAGQIEVVENMLKLAEIGVRVDGIESLYNVGGENCYYSFSYFVLYFKFFYSFLTLFTCVVNVTSWFCMNVKLLHTRFIKNHFLAVMLAFKIFLKEL